MTADKRLVPEIRFRGFTDNWEQRKLTDISEKVTEKNSDNEFSETLTNSAEYGIISQRDFFDKDISNEKNLNTYYVVRDGDFVYNPRISSFAPVGPIKRNTLGRTGVMSPLYYIFRAHNVDGMYLEKYFSSTKWHRFMELNGDTGARADRFAIKDKDFVQMPIPLPNLEEQSKIARFLENVDNLIAANQRKLDLLKEQKKGYLQKMFPKNGAKVPELRFAGFADDWEQRKLGDFGSVGMNRRIYKDQTNEQGEIPFFKIGTFGKRPDAFISRKLFNEYKAKYPYPNPGDMLISASGSIGRTIEYKGEDAYYQDSNIVWLQHDQRLDNSFLKQFYAVVRWQGLEGSTIKRLYNKNILGTHITIPSVMEQREIGEFLGELDVTIALHQRKLEKLQELKKGYLQKMFC